MSFQSSGRQSGKGWGRRIGLLALGLLAVGILVETVYLPFVREPIAKRLAAEKPRPAAGKPIQAPTRRADLRNPEAQAVAKRRAEEILARRDELLTFDEQVELIRLWEELDQWQNMWFLGIRIQKNPNDLWMMQQILYDVQPDFVIEAGTAYGGSALYWAHVLDGLGLEDSKVITIDIADRCQDARKLPLWQKYVEFIHSSSTDPDTVRRIAERVEGKKVLVVLDSWHADHHVLAELEAYGPMVSPGSYIVVEDTHMDLLGMVPEGAEAGPGRAVKTYLEQRGGQELFEVDVERESMVLTFNPGGFLRRRSE